MSHSNSQDDGIADGGPGKKLVRRKLTFIVAVCLVLVGLWQQNQNKPQQPPRQIGDSEREKQERPTAEQPVADLPTVEKAPSHNRHARSPSSDNQSATSPRIEPREADGPSSESDDPTKIPDVTILDEKGHVIFHGTVDLQPTLDRIEARQKLPYQHDGIVFQNREGHLPKKPHGYYTEYVHLTPKHSGPGPQRVVMGKNGEVYYTHDHYRTFQHLRWK